MRVRWIAFIPRKTIPLTPPRSCFISTRWSASTAAPACPCVRCRPFSRSTTCQKSGTNSPRKTRHTSGGRTAFRRQRSAVRKRSLGRVWEEVQGRASTHGRAPFRFAQAEHDFKPGSMSRYIDCLRNCQRRLHSALFESGSQSCKIVAALFLGAVRWSEHLAPGAQPPTWRLASFTAAQVRIELHPYRFLVEDEFPIPRRSRKKSIAQLARRQRGQSWGR